MRALLALLLLAALPAATLAWAEHDASQGLSGDALEAATHGRVRARRIAGRWAKYQPPQGLALT